MASLRKPMVMGTAAVIGLLVAAFLWIAVRRPEQPSFSKKDADRIVGLVQGMVEALKPYARAAAQGRAPTRAIDHSTVGFPTKERRLEDVQAHLEIFESVNGRLPRTLTELVSYLKQHPGSQTGAETGCSLIPNGVDSYLLNCDGWQPQSVTALRSTIAGFTPGIERFYVVDDHVVLWVPPLTVMDLSKGSWNRENKRVP